MDPNGNTIYLTGAKFDNATDTVLAYLAVNPADSTVSLTVKPNADIGIAGHVFEITYHVKDNGTPASQCATGVLTVTAYHTPNYPDIRISVCPEVGNISLSKYIDTIDNMTGIQWSSSISGISVSSPDGAVSIGNLSPAVYTFTYTVDEICVSGQKRKVYLEILKNDRIRKHKDTVVMCYRYAEAIQIDQLFGIEAEGELLPLPPAIASYFEKTSYGGTIMNGRKIYEEVSGFDYGVNSKKIELTYKADASSCLHGKEYTIAIILTPDINN
jgi:chemotaxis protein CheY-P-specific phosphatase CheC